MGGSFYFTSSQAYHYKNQPEKVKEVIKYYNDRRLSGSKKLTAEIYASDGNTLIKTYE